METMNPVKRGVRQVSVCVDISAHEVVKITLKKKGITFSAWVRGETKKFAEQIIGEGMTERNTN